MLAVFDDGGVCSQYLNGVEWRYKVVRFNQYCAIYFNILVQ